MAHLYPHLRIHQVFGANTDVGKTIFTTALCLASAALPLGSAGPTDSEPSDAAQKGLGEKVHYLKPVSTGNLDDSDDAHIGRFAPSTSYKTLYRFSEAVSPHLAVELEKRAMLSEREVGGAPPPPSDEDFVREVGNWLHRASAIEAQSQAVAYVETAGGVHSPGPTGTSQSHLLRPLRLPTVLIGSSELGGISTTRSAFESLMMNGYDVEAVMLFPSRRYGNVEYLRKFFQQEHGIPVWGLGGPNDPSRSIDDQAWGPPPVRNPDTRADRLVMQTFYRGLVRGRTPDEILKTGGETSKEEDVGGVYSVVQHLRKRHSERLHELSTLAGRTRETCWWPFTQHTLTKSDADVNVIDSAYGDFFTALDQRKASRGDGKPTSLLQPLYDGSASWWTQCLGHAPQRLVQAAAKAGARYGHVLFPNGANEPSLYLAEALTGKVESTKGEVAPPELLERYPGAGWASRAFYSDNGSTGMEVAIKMAIQSSITRYAVDRPSSAAAGARAEQGRKPGYMSGRPKREWEVLGLRGSYHGDTIGAMDACEPSVYSEAVDWYRGRGYWFEPPLVEVKDGRVTISLAGDDSIVQESAIPDSIRPTEAGGGGGKMFAATYASMQDAYDVEARLQTDPLAEIYRTSIRAELERLVVVEGRRFGAVIMEPLVMGAGGMLFVDPLFQRILIDVVRESEDLFSLSDPPSRSARSPAFHRARSSSTQEGRDPSEWQGLPVIFDEVFAGLYRLGHATTASVLGTTPDVSCLAKILTGGMVPMSVTLASSSIFRTFSESENKVDALLHGHSYTAHPIGCQVALETLRAIEELKPTAGWTAAKQRWAEAEGGKLAPVAEPARLGSQPVWSFWSPRVVEQLSSLANVDHAVAMGCLLKVCLTAGEGGGGYTSTASVEILKTLRTDPSSLQGHATVPTSRADPSVGGGTLPFNIHARPLGNVIYFMSSLNTPDRVLRTTEEVVLRAVQEAGTGNV